MRSKFTLPYVKFCEHARRVYPELVISHVTANLDKT